MHTRTNFHTKMLMKKIIAGLCILAIVTLLGGALIWGSLTGPVNKNDTSSQEFVVENGAGTKAIGANLKEAGLIKSPLAFYVTAKLLHIENTIQAGTFRISPSQSLKQIAMNLTRGIDDIQITIPEGKRAEEIADILEASIPGYTEEWRQQLVRKEGYLFPDTYQIPHNADISLIIGLLTKEFESKYSQITLSPSNTLTKEELVILASLIEREARHDEDRPMVAGVIVNRLGIDMAVQIDATVQYAVGYQTNTKSWWKKDLTYDDLKIKSPYNTYTNTGLPPTPICNPGIEALEAAANPESHDYLFYITDQNGVNRYAKTLDQHNANIEKYGL